MHIQARHGYGNTEYIQLYHVDTSANPRIYVVFQRSAGILSVENYSNGDISYAVDKAAEQLVVTINNTGAQLTLDISDFKTTLREVPVLGSGENVLWNVPPIIFEEGFLSASTLMRVKLSSAFLYPRLGVDRNADGSFTARLWDTNGRFDVTLYSDEEGRVSGYMFTKNASSTSDPSVGIKRTGCLVEGLTGGSTFNIDLSSVQFINRTGSNIVVGGATIKPEPPEPEEIVEELEGSEPPGPEESVKEAEEAIPEEVLEPEVIPAEPLEEETPEELKTGFTPLSPSSLSIDENGVLRRLKDDGDWEPVYLLACCQFAAMNSAEERNGVYYATPASGVLKVGVSGKDGMGTITSGTLERSTTDLAHELSTMIRAQHAYAANTKVLSTIEDMLTELERL
jgi:flagellar hook protein FlgE